MSEEHDNDNTGFVERLMPRLAGFATGLGVDEATTRTIIEKVVADIPRVSDEDLLAEVRLRMIGASA